MDLAAQGHADYNSGTGVLSHVETPGTPGFFGAGFSDRTLYYGYDQSTGEIISSGLGATASVKWMDVDCLPPCSDPTYTHRYRLRHQPPER